MGSVPDPEGSDSFGWNTDDDQEFMLPSGASPGCFGNGTVGCSDEASSSSGASTKLISHFVGMGFNRDMVCKAIDDNGDENTDAILETLLTYAALEKSPAEREYVACGGEQFPSDLSSSESAEDFLDDFSDEEYLGSEDNNGSMPTMDKTLKLLVAMGYPAAEAAIAMERCGPDASVDELTDCMFAAQTAKAADALLEELPRFGSNGQQRRNQFNDEQRKKKRLYANDNWERKRPKQRERRRDPDEMIDTTIIPNPMIGFGIPAEPWKVYQRTLPAEAIGPPYFYYENVALAPKGVWSQISSYLYEIQPEFVDSKYFSAAARKRGYIHNLPINNRYPLLPIPPQTIHEALPVTERWWPSWDTRTKLNCLQTCLASAQLTDRLRKAVENYNDQPPPPTIQKYVMEQCRKWNLVWVGKHKLAPLEPDEIESLLGFPKNHTRGGGISRTERLKGLGNSFQVDTVAYHLSVLKEMFPKGMTVLSLFSGIGGAEVALHRLGIPMKTVVSVEKSETSKNILHSWWESTNQKGKLIHIDDVQKLDSEKLEQLINSFGGFDLVIGGSPCNNLAGSNRHTRDGLEGEHSSLFYDYFRILNQVKAIMAR